MDNIIQWKTLRIHFKQEQNLTYQDLTKKEREMIIIFLILLINETIPTIRLLRLM